ncbi:MAG: hypothetical protein R3332_00270 [Pseudohongiellaceae bacterium]|nr:hypothetical protein [Pseudohongiellaceae bacterium]
MTPAAILNSEQLKEITGYQREGDLTRYLDENGIPHFRSKNGIWTTVELVNAAGMARIKHTVRTPQESASNDYL